MNKHKVGLVLGSFSAVVHLVWSILVMLGWAQPLYSWILSLHAIETPVVIGAMSIGGAIALIVTAFVVGNIVGWIFASVWNWINK
jgi:hypothetical protein